MEHTAKLIMTLRVDLGASQNVGEYERGNLTIIPIIGGTFEGPGIRGTICCGGADWNTKMDERYSHVSAKYWIKTEDGQVISVENEGVLDNTRFGQSLQTVPRFIVNEDSEYAWMNHGLYAGKVAGSETPDQVIISIYKID